MEAIAAELPECPVAETWLSTPLYAHKSNICHLPTDLRVLVARALLIAGEFDYDVVKVAPDRLHVCLLSCPDFDTNPHPALKYSVTVVLPSKQCCISDFTKTTNQPILHRKETLVSEDYPLYGMFKALSRSEEELGLLSRGDIGTRKQWETLLKAKKLHIKGHSLVRKK
jgi:DNA phosphorothioation-associated putative methyltransferase